MLKNIIFKFIFLISTDGLDKLLEIHCTKIDETVKSPI